MTEIRRLNAEVVALSAHDDRFGVLATQNRLGITYPIIAASDTKKMIKEYDLWTTPQGTSYGTVIIDQNGVVRFVHNSTNEFDRASVPTILDVLRKIKQ